MWVGLEERRVCWREEKGGSVVAIAAEGAMFSGCEHLV